MATEILSEEDKKILQEGINQYTTIVNSMMANGAPQKSGDIRVVKEVIEARSRQVIDTAKLTIDNNSNDVQQQTIEMATEVMKQLNTNKPTEVVGNNNISSTKLAGTVNIVPGQTEHNPAPLIVEEFTIGATS